MREVQDYMDIATMKKSSNTWEMIFFQQMCILCLPNAKFYTLTEEGGVEERDTMVVLGDLIDWSARKNMNVKQLLIIKYKLKDT